MAPPGIRQPLEQEDRKEDKSQSGKKIDSPVVQHQLRTAEPDNRRFEQRQVIGHIIEQVIKLILYIEQCQPDIPQQQDKGQRLVLQQQHQENGKPDNKNKRRQADQEEIDEIGLPIDRNTGRHKV